MTVTIRRPHSGFRYSSHVATTGMYAMIPFEVEVTGGPEIRKPSYASQCQCAQVLRLTDDSVRWLMRRRVVSESTQLSIEAGKNPCICKCMTQVRNVVGKPGRPRIGDRQVTRMYGP